LKEFLHNPKQLFMFSSTNLPTSDINFNAAIEHDILVLNTIKELDKQEEVHKERYNLLHLSSDGATFLCGSNSFMPGEFNKSEGLVRMHFEH
jgi:hypothetical protein